MRVISQDREHDVPYEHATLWRDERVIWACVSGIGKIIMAQYSSEEKSEKAMQKLHEAYAPEPLFIHNDVSSVERAAAGEISWSQALDDMNKNLIISPVSNSSIEKVCNGNIVFRFPQEDEL